MSVYDWSKIATNNQTADAAIDWREGQLPSTVNDSSRAMMAAIAGMRDDMGGVPVIGGAGDSFSLTLSQPMKTLGPGLFSFVASRTNIASVTLAVDGLAAAPLRLVSGTDLTAGEIVAGRAYVVFKNPANAEWLILNALPSKAEVASSFAAGSFIGEGRIYFGASAPSGWAFPYGQALSRTTYAALFAIIGTTYGTGDGTTTFNLPDLRGRVPAGLDNMGGAAASVLTSFGSSGQTRGATGGEQAHTLTTPEMPAHTHTDAGHTHNATDAGHTHQVGYIQSTNATGTGERLQDFSGSTGSHTSGVGNASITVANGTANLGNTGGGGSHNNVQPTMLVNYIIRIS